MDNPLFFPEEKSFYYLSDRKITIENSSCVVQSCAKGIVNVNFLQAKGRRILIKCGKVDLGLSLWAEVG